MYPDPNHILKPGEDAVSVAARWSIITFWGKVINMLKMWTQMEGTTFSLPLPLCSYVKTLRHAFPLTEPSAFT